MKRPFSILAIILVNLTVVFLLLEVGFRSWLYFTRENNGAFEEQVADSKEAAGEKNRVTGKVTLGNLIQKSSDPGRVYEFIPNTVATYLGQPFETNAYGLRDRFYTVEKPKNFKRVVGIGDSVMFGWGVKEEESYLSLVEAAFAKEGASEVEILNFAIPGYNTAMEVSTYGSFARKFSPDIVVVHFIENDLGIPLFMEAPIEFFSFQKSFVAESLSDLNRALRKRPKSKKDLVGVEFSGVDRVKKDKILSQYRYMVGHEGFSNAMRKLAAMVCEDKAAVIILTGRLRGSTGELLRNVAKQYKFELVEAAPTVNKYFIENKLDNSEKGRKKLLWLNDTDPHPSDLGHKLYAETLFPKVKEVLAAINDKGYWDQRCR